MTQTDTTNRLVTARRRRLLNLRTQSAQLDEKLPTLEECTALQHDNQDGLYVFKRRRQEYRMRTLEELLSKPIEFYVIPQSSLPVTTARRPTYFFSESRNVQYKVYELQFE